MTYNVSKGRWIGPTLLSMGVTHLASSDRTQLLHMARDGWLHSASTPERTHALWFTVAGGSLITMGALTQGLAREGLPMPRMAATAFTVTMATIAAATASPGASVGTLVGVGMCHDAWSRGHRR